MTQTFDVFMSVEQPGLRRDAIRFHAIAADGASSNPTWEIRGPGLVAYRFRVSIRADRGGLFRVEVPWAVVNLRSGRPPVLDAERHDVFPGGVPGFLLRVGESAALSLPAMIDGECQPRVLVNRAGESLVPRFSIRLTLLPATSGI